jgi:hypothetical protein
MPCLWETAIDISNCIFLNTLWKWLFSKACTACTGFELRRQTGCTVTAIYQFRETEMQCPSVTSIWMSGKGQQGRNAFWADKVMTLVRDEMNKSFRYRNMADYSSGLENLEYDRGDLSHWPRNTLYPQKFALTSPTSDGHSAGMVRSRTKTTGLYVFLFLFSLFIAQRGNAINVVRRWS